MNATTGNHAVYWRGHQGRLEHVAIAAGTVSAVPDLPALRKHLVRYMPAWRDRKSTPLAWSSVEVSL